MKKYILKRVSNFSLAEDLTQEVFLKIHANLNSLKESQKVEAWVFQIARNVITDHYRSKRELEELPSQLLAPQSNKSEEAKKEIGVTSKLHGWR